MIGRALIGSGEARSSDVTEYVGPQGAGDWGGPARAGCKMVDGVGDVLTARASSDGRLMCREEGLDRRADNGHDASPEDATQG